MKQNINTIKPTRESKNLSYSLYIIATPIGNLGDITLRALETLQSVDLILCEDTRISGKLLSAYEISTKKFRYHEHNAEGMRPKIMEKLKEGQKIALISDAGMPLISDPGYKLVESCIKENISITCLPGASATLTALALSGLPTDKFMFAGFLPSKTSARKKALAELKYIETTIIFYETAPRLISSLDDILNTLGDRKISVARELTKKFEEVKRGNISELISYYQEKGTPKGEIVLILKGADNCKEISKDDINAMLLDLIEKQGMSTKDAAATLAKELNMKKRAIYDMALSLTGKK